LTPNITPENKVTSLEKCDYLGFENTSKYVGSCDVRIGPWNW